MNQRNKCNCWIEDKRCNQPLFIVLRVQVFHPDSLRKSWQTWYLCAECFEDLESVKGKGWGCKYKDNKKPFAPLIQYEIF